MSLRFRQLRYFVETVDAGSMNKAAAKLNLAPNALSLQIKAIEMSYGLRLLNRHPRGVTPTPAGRRFYQDAQRVLTQLAQAEQGLRECGDTPVVFRMGVIPSVIHAVKLNTLRATDLTRHNIRIELVEGFFKDLLARLHAGDLHYVIGTTLAGSRGVAGVYLLKETLVYATCPSCIASDREVALSEISAWGDLVRFGNASQVWDVLDSAAQKAGIALESACTVESPDLLRRMLGRGHASAVLPLGLIEKEWRGGEIAVFRIADVTLTRRIAVFWRDHALQLRDHHDAVLDYATGLIASYHSATAPFSELMELREDMAVPA